MAKKKQKELHILVIKSDELDEALMKKVKKEFKKALKNKSQKMAVLGLSPNDSAEVITVRR